MWLGNIPYNLLNISFFVEKLKFYKIIKILVKIILLNRAVFKIHINKLPVV